MKNKFLSLVLTLFVVVASLMSGCNGNDGKYETRYSADGKDSIVYVHYRDNNGQYQDFFINYLMFRTLFGNGGYNGYAACHNYYNHNPAPRINNYHTYVMRDNSTRYTTPRNSVNNSSSNKAASKPAYSSPSRSYSSPSRSYSSPSKSYSSPSRSYSSPSRSYSSPSRSYSSPSRH